MKRADRQPAWRSLYRVPLFLAVVVLALSASTPNAVMSASHAPALRVFASKYYHIHTDLPRGDVLPIGRHMDAIYEQYQQRFADFDTRDDQPMPLYLFRERSSYYAFLRKHGLDGQNSGGMFFVNQDIAGLATWTDGKSRSQTLAVLQHEGFHQFAWRHIGPNIPVWANEGLAQYFEDAILVRDRMTVGLAGERKVEQVKYALGRGQTTPVAELLAMGQDQWGATLRQDVAKSELLYAQAWSIAYFLIHADEGRYRAAFSRYLLLLSQGHHADAAYQKAFGSGSVKNLERAWRKYAEAQEPDPLSTAAYRLEFVGTALRFLDKRGEAPPQTMEELRRLLATRGFTVTRSSHHTTHTIKATDAEVFTFNRPSGDPADLVLLQPSRDDLPMRAAAPGLRPEPTLIWARDASGELVMDIEYR